MPFASEKQWIPGETPLASADINSWVIPVRGLKTANTPTTSTVKANDPDLVVTLLPGAVYVWELVLLYSVTGGGNLAFSFAPPPAWTCFYSILFNNSGASLVLEDHVPADAMLATGGIGGAEALNVDGIVQTTVGGGLALSWASSSSANTATTLAGSSLTAWRIG